MLRQTVLIVAIAAGLFSFSSANFSDLYKKGPYIQTIKEDPDVEKNGEDPNIQNKTDRIVGGRNANILEHPYQVSILNNGEHFCGGSIIRENIVLTAAHCLVGMEGQMRSLEVVAGATSWVNGGGGQIKKVETFICHPSWDRMKMDSDVCVVKVTSPFMRSQSVKKIDMCPQPLEDGALMVLSGFGLTQDKGPAVSQVLKSVRLQHIPWHRCGPPRFAYPLGHITQNMMCGFSYGEGSCQGDSGGPLVRDLGDRYGLYGVVSFGMDCADPNYPGVYATVCTLKPWIESVIKYLI